MIFLSTLPARGATFLVGKARDDRPISIHAPREGSDQLPSLGFVEMLEFLSTLPARGATALPVMSCRRASIFLSTLPARGATRQTFSLAAATV